MPSKASFSFILMIRSCVLKNLLITSLPSLSRYLREMLMVRDEENLSLTDNIEVNPRIFHGLLGTITESW